MLGIRLHRNCIFRSIYARPVRSALRTTHKMAETIPQIRSRPDSEGDSPRPPVEKKLRLDEEASPIRSAAKDEPRKAKKKKKQKRTLPEPYSNEDVLWRDITELLGAAAVDKAIADKKEWDSPFEYREEVQLVVASLTPGGEGIAIAPAPKPPWAILVPFVLPGEKITARIYRSSRMHSYADLVNIDAPNLDLRDDSRVKCKYFGSCAGCQYQSLAYETQLELKRNVVVKAYKNFSEIPESAIPEIGTTIASPKQYEYRTKITPHFDAPPKKYQKEDHSGDTTKPEWLKIGFNQIGKRQVMDIEECPIATPIINQALGPIRDNAIKNINSYKRGVSLLLRDSLEIVDDLAASVEKHLCVTNHKSQVREVVGDKFFEYPGGSFFQNNNSVLVPLTSYVRDAIFADASQLKPTHLVDAYCGSGLFAITLSPDFEQVAGIELSADSIRSATHNAELNKLPAGKCTFRAGDAADIFSVVDEFPRDRTVMVIDPPRKGTDDNFIEQLMNFGCGTVVYVSCNVHTQARDIGKILNMEVPGGRKYVLESLRGFDLFPQTAHVESIAVLRLAPLAS